MSGLYQRATLLTLWCLAYFQHSAICYSLISASLSVMTWENYPDVYMLL